MAVSSRVEMWDASAPTSWSHFLLATCARHRMTQALVRTVGKFRPVEGVWLLSDAPGPDVSQSPPQDKVLPSRWEPRLQASAQHTPWRRHTDGRAAIGVLGRAWSRAAQPQSSRPSLSLLFYKTGPNAGFGDAAGTVAVCVRDSRWAAGTQSMARPGLLKHPAPPYSLGCL